MGCHRVPSGAVGSRRVPSGAERAVGLEAAGERGRERSDAARGSTPKRVMRRGANFPRTRRPRRVQGVDIPA